MSRTSSGSSRSDRGVNPTRSQNSAVTRRRSSRVRGSASGIDSRDSEGLDARSICSCPPAVEGDATDPCFSLSGEPQPGQNRLPGSVRKPHEGQVCSSAAPQLPQNRPPEAFSCPQETQPSTPGTGALSFARLSWESLPQCRSFELSVVSSGEVLAMSRRQTCLPYWSWAHGQLTSPLCC
jgi:hypothetical protein